MNLFNSGKRKSINIANPEIGISESLAVLKVMRSKTLTQGAEVKKFEEEFSQIVEGRECVAVNSGTSALHICLMALGIGPGDEVIVPSFTFAATANTIVLTGATPVFADIDSRTFNLDPADVANKISSKTKAVVVVHLFGLPADMKEIMSLAENNQLLVVEDAAQAHMAEIEGRRVGTFGDAAAFSFYPTKNMTTAEGGMSVFKNSAISRTAKLLRNQGMEKRYENEIVGFNLRMSEIHAAIGRVQLRNLAIRTEKRINNAEYLDSQIRAACTPFVPNGYKHVFHQFTLFVSGRRDELYGFLGSMGINCGIYYPKPTHKLQSFSKMNHLELPNSIKASESVLSIPVHPKLTKRDLDYIAKNINRFLSN